ASATDSELALRHHCLRCKDIAGDRIGSGVQVQRVKHGNLIGVRCLVIRWIVWQRLRAVDSRKTVVLSRENIQTRLGIRDRSTIAVSDLGNLPGSYKGGSSGTGLPVTKNNNKQRDERKRDKSAHRDSPLRFQQIVRCYVV